MPSKPLVVVALSGGVDSAVAALLLKQQGHAVECLHMTNWEDDDGYCQAANDLQDARKIADHLGVSLHRVNFSREYYDGVFADFLAQHRAGLTPNPDVLCNRYIKFGVLHDYAHRLGGAHLATGHYARIGGTQQKPQLLKGIDATKDQSYFLHAIDRAALAGSLFPLGAMTKQDVRRIATDAGLPVSHKPDSTGICFIGERPFAAFLSRYIADEPGDIVTEAGEKVGEHRGLAFYTVGQRQGLGIGGTRHHGDEPWYVAAKSLEDNRLIVVQGGNHPLLLKNWLRAVDQNWFSETERARAVSELRCAAKVRYRQTDQACRVRCTGSTLEVQFDRPQRAVTPGQYVVLYDDDRCLGGARITETAWVDDTARAIQAN